MYGVNKVVIVKYMSAFVGVCFDEPINKFYIGKTLAACSKNHKKHVATLYEENSELLNITAV